MGDKRWGSLLQALETISQGLLMIDTQDKVVIINRRAVELLGLPPHLSTRGEARTSAISLPGSERRTTSRSLSRRLRYFQQAWCRIQTTWAKPRAADPRRAPPVYQRVRPNGLILEVRTHVLKSGSGVRTFADITEQRKASEQGEYLALHDSLTQLANRVCLEKAFHGEREVKCHSRMGESAAV